MYMYTSPTLKLHCKNHFELFLHKTVSAALDIVKHSCKHITIGPLFCLLSKLLLTVVVLDCSTLTGSSGGSGGSGGGGSPQAATAVAVAAAAAAVAGAF
jgi:hypothetical protein